MMYEYLLWTLLLGAFWLFAYVLNPALRQKMFWSGAIGFIFGFGELYFIPNYWTPQTLFNFGMKYHIAIESFLLGFFLGGVAAFMYEGVLRQKTPIIKRSCHPICRCLPLFMAFLAFFSLEAGFPLLNIIYVSILTCIIGGVTAMFVYPELRRHILLGSLLFGIVYWASLFIIDLFSGGWIARTWTMTGLSGITFLNVPLEEIVFGFSFGAFWTPLYEEVCQSIKPKKSSKRSAKGRYK